MRTSINTVKINSLCRETGTSISGLEKKLGFGNGTIRQWGSHYPRVDTIMSVAEFFGVKIDDLIEKE